MIRRPPRSPLFPSPTLFRSGLPFHNPADDSAEMQYLRDRRTALGGALPRRETVCDRVPVPALEQYAQFALAPAGKEMSTTMAFVRMLGGLLKDAQLGPRIVPIVADEARTFGMADRKSTRLNSSHLVNSYAVLSLK